MSKYTVELRWLVEQCITNAGHTVVPFDETYWNDAYTNIGLTTYPIFEENYRSQLNDKIIRHFYVREIGLETAGLFRHYMNMKMNEIMPYYNQLYKSLLDDFDPLTTRNLTFHDAWSIDNTDDWTVDNTDEWNVDNTKDTDGNWTRNQDVKDTGTVDSTTTSRDREVFQDTPMSILDNPSPNAIENLDYATTVTYNDGNTTNHQDTTDNRTDTSDGTNKVGETGNEKGDRDKNEKGERDKNEKGDKWRTEKGYDRPIAELIKMLRDSFINVDMMIIEELEPLFMSIG